MRNLLLLLLAAALFVGCASVRPLSSHVNESYLAYPEQYTVVGPVEGRASITVLFGILPLSADAGYHAAYKNALGKATAQGATGLIEVYSDTRRTSFLGLYFQQTTIVHAKGIKKI